MTVSHSIRSAHCQESSDAWLMTSFPFVCHWASKALTVPQCANFTCTLEQTASVIGFETLSKSHHEKPFSSYRADSIGLLLAMGQVRSKVLQSLRLLMRTSLKTRLPGTPGWRLSVPNSEDHLWVCLGCPALTPHPDHTAISRNVPD